MTHAARLAGLFLCLAASPALNSPAFAATCTAEIDALSKRVAQEGRESIAASTSGKAEAAQREGQDTGEAPSSRPSAQSAQAGAGSEKAREAKIALDEARMRDGKGDAKGCADALDRVRKSLDGAP